MRLRSILPSLSGMLNSNDVKRPQDREDGIIRALEQLELKQARLSKALETAQGDERQRISRSLQIIAAQRKKGFSYLNNA